MSNIRVLQIGCREFSRGSFQILNDVINRWNHRNFWQQAYSYATWLGIVESSLQRREQLAEQLAAERVPLFSTLQDALSAVPTTGTHLLVYDVAESLGRLDRVKEVLAWPNSFVLAEEPLLMLPEDLIEARRLAARHQRFTTGFPENAMAVTRAASDVLKSFEIEEIACFQCNSMGGERLTSFGSRAGAAGGSLFHSSSHAHAWCHYVLSPEKTAVVGSRFTKLMPARFAPNAGFMDYRTGNETQWLSFAADAEAEVTAAYHAGGRRVPVRVLSSWRGIRQDIREYVSRLNLPQAVLNSEKRQGDLGRFNSQEIRLKVIHGLYDSRAATLVVSTLPRARRGVPPRAWLSRGDAERYRFPHERPLRTAHLQPTWEGLQLNEGRPESLEALFEECLKATVADYVPWPSPADSIAIDQLILDARSLALSRFNVVAA